MIEKDIVIMQKGEICTVTGKQPIDILARDLTHERYF